MNPLIEDLDSQVAGNYRPLYPKVDHYWFKEAHNYWPLVLQGVVLDRFPDQWVLLKDASEEFRGKPSQRSAGL